MIVLPLAGTKETVTIAPSKIIAVGLNYSEHVKESATFNHEELGLPKEPVLFAKTPNVLIGPGEPIMLPRIIVDNNVPEPRTDLEAELAIIIGKKGKYIPAEKAYEYVLGYSCFNDVSQRNTQKSDVSGWFRGKSFDTFGPIGPVVVPQSVIGDPRKLNICSRINGEVKQKSNTSQMIFSVAVLIEYISRNFTLEAGDIIATGTPAGVARISPGDTVEIEIEGIGILKNPVVQEK